MEFIEDVCWACKRPVKQVIEHLHGGAFAEGVALTSDDFYVGRWNPRAYTVASLSNLLEAVRLDVTNDQLAAQGLNLIGRRDVINGKQTRFPYCNLCLHCSAPQNNHFLSKRLYAALHTLNSGEDDCSPSVSNNLKEQASQVIDIALIPRCRVPDDWLLKKKRPLLLGREVLLAVLATWKTSAKERPC